jgi:hypothetical protein
MKLSMGQGLLPRAATEATRPRLVQHRQQAAPEAPKKSPYRQKLDDLAAANKKKDEIIIEKNRAIEALKGGQGGQGAGDGAAALPKGLEALEGMNVEVVDETTIKIDGKEYDRSQIEPILQIASGIANKNTRGVLEQLHADGLKTVLAGITDADERALTEYHYNNTVTKTGNIAADVENARVLANGHVVDTYQKNQAAAIAAEGTVAALSGATPAPGAAGEGEYASPAAREAASLLDAIGAKDAKKFLPKS